MGLFSRTSSDSKARIEELKKKIQAEQAAFNADHAAPAAPAQPAPAPQPAAPVAPPVQPVAPPAPQPVYQQQYVPPQAPAYQAPAPTYQQPRYEEPARDVRRPFHLDEELEDSMEEIKTGIILDLGEGMSLNLPIRSRMRLDEFLHIADRVRELQRLQRQQQY